MGRKHSPLTTKGSGSDAMLRCAGMGASHRYTGQGVLGENNVFGAHEATYRYSYE